MPSGRVHTSVTLLTSGYLAAGAVLGIYWGVSGPEVFAASAGCFLGIFLTPDLDANMGNIGFAIMRRKLGRPLTWLWRLYWMPYTKLVPHRSWISHFPIVSTMIRLIYVGWWIPIILKNSDTISWWALWGIVGLMLADFHHFWLDMISPDKEEFR